MTMTCAVPECDRTDVNKVQGLCHPHDQRRRRGKPLEGAIINRRLPERPECQVPECPRLSESKTGRRSRYCASHNQQVDRGVTPGIYREQGKYKVCQVPTCEKPFRYRKMCVNHAARSVKYGLAPDAFIEILSRPCEVCGDSDPSRATIDHDHACCPGETSCGGCVRGRLCSPCNLGMGAFKDSGVLLESARRYLLKT